MWYTFFVVCMKVLLVGGSFDATLDAMWASYSRKDGDVAIIAVRGALSTSRWNDEGNPESIMQMVQAAIDDTSVAGMVMDIDSPGGEANLMRQLGNMLYKSPKKVVTYARRMESGGLWIGTMSDYVYLADTIDLSFGSVGAFMVHRSDKEYDKKEGFKYTIINAPDSPQKIWGNSYEDLTKEQIDYFTENTAYIRGEFVKAITKARPKIKAEALTGLSYRAEQAIEMGFGDKIGTLQDAIDKARSLASKQTPKPANQSSFYYSNSNTMNFPNLSKFFGFGANAQTVVPPTQTNAQPQTPAPTAEEMQQLALVDAKLGELTTQVEVQKVLVSNLQTQNIELVKSEANAQAQVTALQAKIQALETENAKLKNLPADEPTSVGANSTGVVTKTESQPSYMNAPWNKHLKDKA